MGVGTPTGHISPLNHISHTRGANQYTMRWKATYTCIGNCELYKVNILKRDVDTGYFLLILQRLGFGLYVADQVKNGMLAGRFTK